MIGARIRGRVAGVGCSRATALYTDVIYSTVNRNRKGVLAAARTDGDGSSVASRTTFNPGKILNNKIIAVMWQTAAG